MAQTLEALRPIFKTLAGFSCVVARLRPYVKRWPLLQYLVLEVHAIGDVLGKQYDVTARVGVASINRFGALWGRRPFNEPGNCKRGNRQRIYHTGLNR